MKSASAILPKIASIISFIFDALVIFPLNLDCYLLAKALLSNKMIRLDQVILLAYKAKNADIALAKASIFNVVGEQKNTYKWSGYCITEPKVIW